MFIKYSTMTENLFNDKDTVPNEEMLKQALTSNFSRLDEIRNFVLETFGETREEWKFYGKKTGWLLKKFFKKRNLFFIKISDGCFTISFAFGEKAVAAIVNSDISQELKTELTGARKYVEGRGLTVKAAAANLEDIKKLIQLKIDN